LRVANNNLFYSKILRLSWYEVYRLLTTYYLNYLLTMGLCFNANLYPKLSNTNSDAAISNVYADCSIPTLL